MNDEGERISYDHFGYRRGWIYWEYDRRIKTGRLEGWKGKGVNLGDRVRWR